MCSLSVSNNSLSSQHSGPTTVAQLLPAPKFRAREVNESTDQTLTRLMQDVIDKKNDSVTAVLDNRVNISEAVMVGGDAFSMASMTFSGALIVKPSLRAIPGILMTSLAFGTVAGAINIGVAIICIKEGIEAWNNGNKKEAMIQFSMGILYIGIGGIMVLASLALQLSVLGGVSALLATNPWLLPVLFFLASLPLIIDIVQRISRNIKNQDWSSTLLKNKTIQDFKHLINGEADDKLNLLNLKPLLAELTEQNKESVVRGMLSWRMEKLQADMGVKAAIETFKLLRIVMENKNTEAEREKLEKQLKITKAEISKWNRAQWVRLFQQTLYTAAFGVSMGVLASPQLNTPMVNATQSFAMGAANAVPLYMDSQWPFMRNVPRVIPKVCNRIDPDGKELDVIKAS